MFQKWTQQLQNQIRECECGGGLGTFMCLTTQSFFRGGFSADGDCHGVREGGEKGRIPQNIAVRKYSYIGILVLFVLVYWYIHILVLFVLIRN